MAAFAAGGMLMPGALTGDAGRMLVIFLGLVSASILPAVTLLVNSMTGGGRSVAAVNALEAELQIAMDALFLLFGCVALVVIALVALSIPMPEPVGRLPYMAEILPRIGQGFVASVSTVIVLRLGQIPAILRRTLAIRHKNAADEARRSTLEKAPDQGSVGSTFKKHPQFGASIPLEDVH